MLLCLVGVVCQASSTVDVSRAQARRWMFAQLSLLPGSKSVWADGQTKESTANGAAAGLSLLLTCSVLNCAYYFESIAQKLMADEPELHVRCKVVFYFDFLNMFH